jgi:hypothetical protein
MSHCSHIIADEFLASRTVEMVEAHCGISTRGADKSLARPTSRCILFDGESI